MPNRVDQIYVCAVCGNEVRIEKDGGGRLVCCGQEMKEKEGEE
jgi:desulfoferrodoxin-like iron-binding protein